MSKDNQSSQTTELTPEAKYKIDKNFELQQRKFDEVSSIAVGNSNIAAISLMADKFAKAGDLIPKEFQGQPEKCFVAIYKGASLGLDAFTSLQRIAVVNGRATIWGDTALALVRNSGLLTKFEEDLYETDGKLIARCIVQRKGEKEHVSEFSQQDAELAKLWGNNVWAKYPKRMLKYRARAYALRDIFADVLDGLYLKEEIEGDDNFEKDITPKSKTANAHVPPAAIEKSFSPVQTDLEEVVAEVSDSNSPSVNTPFSDQSEIVFDNSEAVENAFNKIDSGIKSMQNSKGLNTFFDYSSKDDLELLKAHKRSYYEELVNRKNKRLEELSK